MRRVVVAAVVGVAVATGGVAASDAAGQAGGGTATTTPQAGEMAGDRLTFLMTRLASVEASLAAVNRAIAQAGYKTEAERRKADLAREGNELMDRKAGGPVAWDKFYGKTADKFFYHPTDANTRYQFGNDNRRGKAPVPAAQRPPQLDYIYRANAQDQQRADRDAAQYGRKIEDLVARRRQLEAEQVGLWGKVAMEGVAARGVGEGPLYAARLKGSETGSSGDANAQRVEAVRACVTYVRQIGRLADQVGQSVERDPAGALERLSAVGVAAERELSSRLAGWPSVAGELKAEGTKLRDVGDEATRLSALGQNVAEAWRLAEEGEQAGDAQRKGTFRAAMQEALVEWAEAAVDVSDGTAVLAADWRVTPEPGQPSGEKVELPAVSPTAGAQDVVAKAGAGVSGAGGIAREMPGPSLTGTADYYLWQFEAHAKKKTKPALLKLYPDGTLDAGDGGRGERRSMWTLRGDQMVVRFRDAVWVLKLSADRRSAEGGAKGKARVTGRLLEVREK